MSDFSSVHTAAEIPDMRSTIDDINKILQTIQFNEDAARQKIYEINAKHPDNKMIWNLFHANIPSGKSVDEMQKDWQNRWSRDIYSLKIAESENPNEQAENADPQPDSPEHW